MAEGAFFKDRYGGRKYPCPAVSSILHKIIADSEGGDFSDFLEQFELNNFSAEIRNQAISLAEQAFNAANSKC